MRVNSGHLGDNFFDLWNSAPACQSVLFSNTNCSASNGMVLVPILGQSVDDSPAQTESPEGLGIVRREQSDKVSGLSAQTSVSWEEADGNSQKELKFEGIVR